MLTLPISSSLLTEDPTSSQLIWPTESIQTTQPSISRTTESSQITELSSRSMLTTDTQPMLFLVLSLESSLKRLTFQSSHSLSELTPDADPLSDQCFLPRLELLPLMSDAVSSLCTPSESHVVFWILTIMLNSSMPYSRTQSQRLLETRYKQVE